MSEKKYFVNEIFYSIQGEGARAGTPNLFVRFAGCNLTCRRETEGFDCDTNFSGGEPYALDDLLLGMEVIGGPCRNVILTGGEPLLQVDDALIKALVDREWYFALETNGTHELPAAAKTYVAPYKSWVCVSPKTAEHTLRVKVADEVKYVMHAGQALPKPTVSASYYLLSPAVQPEGRILQEDIDWCVNLIKKNPKWRLSIQQHKFLKLR